MSAILPQLPGMATTPTATDREKLSAVSKQFEAVFVREMLAAARKSEFGGDELFGSQALDTFRQMQDEHFADVAVQTGALGFSTIIEAQMARLLPAGAAPGTGPSTSSGQAGAGVNTGSARAEPAEARPTTTTGAA